MIQNSSILIALTDQSITSHLVGAFQSMGAKLHFSTNAEDTLSKVKEIQFNVAIVDLSMPGNSGLSLLRDIKLRSPSTHVLVFSPERQIELLPEAMELGAFCYFDRAMFNASDILILTTRAIESQNYKDKSQKRLEQMLAYVKLSEEVPSKYDLTHVLRIVAKRAMALIRGNYADIYLIEKGKIFIRQSWDGIGWKDSIEETDEMFAETIQSSIGSNGEDRNSDSVEKGNIVNSHEQSSLTVPIATKKGKYLGMFKIGYEKDQYHKVMFDDNMALLEELARTAADSIQKVRSVKGADIGTRTASDYSDTFKTITDNSPNLIFIAQDDRYKYANKRALKTLNLTNAELLSVSIYDLTVPDYREILRNNIALQLSGKEVAPYEIALFDRSGSEIFLEINGLKSEYMGNPAVLLIAQNITEYKKTDAEVLNLAAAIRSLHSAVTITDVNMNIVYINPSHEKIFGYELEELMGKQSSMLYPFEDPSGVSKKINEALFMVGWEGERLGVRKNGEVFPVLEKTSVVKDKTGNPVAIVSVQEDVTIRKRLEQALRESEERYRIMVETAGSAIIAVDNKGIVNMFNPAAEKMFEYTAKEIIDGDASPLVPEKYRGVFDQDISGFLETGLSQISSGTVEFTGCKKSGEEFPLEVSISSCKIGGEKLYTAIVFDITDRKFLQEQLVHSEKMAAIGQLISGVTHEVNNPLAVVLGYSELLLLKDDLSEDSRANVKIIHEEALRSKKVIQDLLSFARKHGPERMVTNINEIIERTLSLKEYDLKKNNIKVVPNLDPELPTLMADPNQLQQVFLNIVINAEHALSDRHDFDNRIFIETRVNRESELNGSGEDHVEIIFKDNGPGIKKEALNKLFDPFFTTKPEGKGTGLGLSVSYGIIKEHQGELIAFNNEDGGACFVIKLPLAEEEIDIDDPNFENFN